MAYRVVISKNVEELLKLGKAVLKKHQALGKDSPLNMLPWGKVGPSIDKALEQHKLAEKLRRDMEKAYESRDKKIPAIRNILLRSRDLLKGIYRGEMRKLGDFGFTVDSTPRRKKKN